MQFAEHNYAENLHIIVCADGCTNDPCIINVTSIKLVHLRNLLWQPKLREVVLLDFGNAMILPPTITAELAKTFSPINDPLAVYLKHLSTLVRAVIDGRHLTNSQPDSHMLRHLQGLEKPAVHHKHIVDRRAPSQPKTKAASDQWQSVGK